MDSNNKLARFNAPNSNVSQNFQDNDLWGYIANNQEINFGLNTRIQNHIDWISTQPEYLASISKRAEPFLYQPITLAQEGSNERLIKILKKEKK